VPASSSWAIRIRPAAPALARWPAWAAAFAAAGCVAQAAGRAAGPVAAIAVCGAALAVTILVRRLLGRGSGVLELHASAAGPWRLRDAAGWHEARLARVWRCGAWLTARFLCRAPDQAERPLVVTFWRGRLAPDAWRRLNGLVSWHMGRPAPTPVRGRA